MPRSRPTQIPLSTALAVWLLTAPCMAASPAVQPAADILARAESFLTAAAERQHSGRIDVKLGHLDPRLRLTRCDRPLEAFQPSGARLNGQTSVGVRCPSASGWTIYVPAKIDVFDKALVTTRALAKGEQLNAGDVQVTETEVSKLGQGHMRTTEEIQGLVLRRPVPAGTVLTPALVKSPRLIRRGARVTLINSQGPIKVEMLGEAISDAALGERVRVRALNSDQIVEGWVESASVVKVTL